MVLGVFEWLSIESCVSCPFCVFVRPCDLVVKPVFLSLQPLADFEQQLIRI